MGRPASSTEAKTRVQTVMSFGESSEVDAPTDRNPIRAKPGNVLRRRYRLDELLVQRPESQTWRAFDEMLARPVVVHLLPADRSNDAVLAAARRAAVAGDYRFLRVLDATIPSPAEVPDNSGIGPYIVCEYAAGQTLEELLATGPLSTLEAAWLIREVANALAGMHARGLYHQRLSPDTIVVTGDGLVKIVGFLLEAEMAPDHRPSDPPEADDVQALGRLLYATLAAHWPAGRAYGLAAAMSDSTGALMTPMQINPSVSPTLDQICTRILQTNGDGAPLRTASGIATALSRVLGTADASEDLEKRVRPPVLPTAEATLVNAWPTDTAATAPLQTTHQVTPDTPRKKRRPTKPRKPRKPLRWLRVVAPLAVVALAGGLVAVVVTQGPSTNGAAPDLTSTDTSVVSEQRQIVAAQDFDPEGNGEERPQQVPRAWDGDPSTSWRTMNYWEGDIGNKTGVGLIFDLGEVRQLSRVELDLDGNGTSLEVRVPTAAESATQPPLSGIDQWQQVGGATRTPAATSISLAEPVKTRFVLVYLTELPPVGSEFTGAIAEARFWS